MSFEVFNYSRTLEEISNTIYNLSSRIITYSRRQLEVAGLDARTQAVVIGDNARILETIERDRQDIEDLEEMRRKIRALNDLPTSMKSQLYQLYTILGVRLEEYAKILPVCYEGLMFCLVPMMESVVSKEISTELGKELGKDKIRAEYRKYERLPLPRYYYYVNAEHFL